MSSPLASPSASSSAPPPASSPPPAASSSPPPSASSPPPLSSPPPSASAPPPSSSPPPPAAASPPPSPVTSSPPPPATSGTTSPPSPSNSSTPTTTASHPPPPSTSSTSTNASPPPPATKSSPTSSSTTSSSSSSVSAPALIGIGVAGVIALSVILVLLYCLCCKKKRRKQYYPGDYYPPGGPPGGLPAHYKDSYPVVNARQHWDSPAGTEVLVNAPPPPPSYPSPKNGYGPTPPAIAPTSLGGSKSWFTYEELAVATDGFAISNLLGEGGFGCVYKGVLPGGQLVAVKQLKIGGGQGEKEFRAEVEIISRVHHRHLVSLVGYCIADTQRLLVYDYVPNGTLEYHLHGRGRPVMDWATRVKIACGAARGLAYLHEDCHPRIIHRDIKSSNILLDNNFDAQVSDFGLAKLTSDTNTHVTTRVMGTFGYLAPEYASSGKLTEKSDVFSFGVVLLELVTGRKPVDPAQPLGEESLVEWARPLLMQINGEEDLELLADTRLNRGYDQKEMLRMVEAAAACVRHSATKRPRMGQVVRALEDDVAISDLSKGVKPGHSNVYGSSFTSTDYDSSSYSADMKRFRRMALGSQEYGSEYSGGTSEYGMNPSASSGEYHTSREVDRNAGNVQSPKA